MKHVKALALALLATGALGAVASTAAQAIEAPYWGIESKRLVAGESREVTVKEVNKTEYTMTLLGNIPITCTHSGIVPGGKILGSNTGSPGTSKETLTFAGCTITNDGTCAIGHNGNGEIVSEKLKDELVYDVKNGESKSIAIEFTPETGSVLTKITFFGVGCTELAASVINLEGQIAAQVLGGTSEATRFLLELGRTPVLAATQYLAFPITRIKTVLLDENGIGSQKSLNFTLAGKAVSLVGESEVKLVNGKQWCIIA